MTTEKTVSVVLYVLFSVIVTMASGLIIWAGLDVSHNHFNSSTIAKICCSVVLFGISALILFGAIKFSKPQRYNKN